MTYHFSGKVASEVALACGLVTQQISSLQKDTNLDEEMLLDLRLILSELMINGCEHGNQNDRTKKVWLDLDVNDKKIDITVRDEGKGFCLNLETDELCHSSCGGRGLRIVSKLCDEMTVDKNEVHCVLYLDTEPSELAVGDRG